MPLFECLKDRVSKAIPIRKASFREKDRAGLLVTSEFDKALEECKSKVARIAKECRAKNRKFRFRCL